jgi:hypothetical protein
MAGPGGAVAGGAAALVAEVLGEAGGLKLSRLAREINLSQLGIGAEALPQRG